MDDPVTQLDERFSDPGTQPTTWAAAQEALEAAQLSWISTVRADGRPHVTPLVAVWLDGAAHFSTGATEQKAGHATYRQTPPARLWVSPVMAQHAV